MGGEEDREQDLARALPRVSTQKLDLEFPSVMSGFLGRLADRRPKARQPCGKQWAWRSPKNFWLTSAPDAVPKLTPANADAFLKALKETGTLRARCATWAP